MNDQTKTFGQAAVQGLTAAAASQEQSTKAFQSFDVADHKRAFLETFRRWSILFKRKDNDIENDKWLIAEYYDSLGHLSEQGLDLLTKQLKENCTFFPTVKECLDIMRPADRWDYGHPFRGNPPHLFVAKPPAVKYLTSEPEIGI